MVLALLLVEQCHGGFAFMRIHKKVIMRDKVFNSKYRESY